MEPNLKHYEEFKEVLENYQVSYRAKNTLKDLKLIIMLAPSSTGRNTIIQRLLKDHKYYFVISDTTRPPQVRDGKLEKNGVNYFFRTEEEMLADIKHGEFLEAEIIHQQQVSGISIRELENAKNAEKIAITDVDMGGVKNILRAKPDAISIMLLPPSIKEWKHRMASRGSMTKLEQTRRTQTALKIFKRAIDYAYFQFLIAEDLERSVEVVNILTLGGDNPHQQRGKELVKQLYRELSETRT